MTKSNKGILLGLTLITIVLTLSVQTGCNAVDAEYLMRLDSLDQTIVETEKHLSIDFSTISNREEAITRELQYMNKYYDRIFTEELGNNLTKYKGIKKTYAHFLNEYPNLFNEMKALQKQARDLRESVNKNELSKEAFKKYYHTEMADATSNNAFAEKLSLSIHALEPEYQRISALIQQEVSSLALRDSVFKEVLQRDSAAMTQ